MKGGSLRKYREAKAKLEEATKSLMAATTPEEKAAATAALQKAVKGAKKAQKIAAAQTIADTAARATLPPIEAPAKPKRKSAGGAA